MSHRRPLLVSLAAGGGAAALAVGLTVGAPSALAVSMPSSQSSSQPATSTGDGLHDTLTGPGTVVEDVTSRLTEGTSSITSGPSGSGAATSSGSPAAPATTGSGGSGSGGSGDAPLAPIGSGAKDALAQADEKTANTPLARVVPGSGPGEALKLAVNAAPLAKACVEVTGSGTAVANLDVTVGGHDISTPLIEALPGLLAPCPSGSVPESDGADGAVSELVGACVRISGEPPVNASLLLLDRELVAELTEAGVPLEKLVVPCPAPGGGAAPGTGGGGAGGGDGANGSGDGGADEGAGAGSGGSIGSGGSGGSDACDPSFNAQTTASSLLPTSGPQALPWLLLALALVGRRRLGQLATLVSRRGATSATQL